MRGSCHSWAGGEAGSESDLQQGIPAVGLAEIATASDWCQRWDRGRHSWRHRREGGFDPSWYDVEPVAEGDARDFVAIHHYSGSYPASSWRFGLYDVRGDAHQLVGVAVFGVPVQAAVLTRTFPDLAPYTQSTELSRFVLEDSSPGNSESWFLARCFTELHSHGVRGVVSFADPVPRRRADGTPVAIGHVGFIYQALSAVYTGRGAARTVTLLPDGTVLNARTAQKIRAQDQGHEYAERRLVALGAAVPGAGQRPADWLQSALGDIGARTIRHHGAHRYAFPLGAGRRQREQVRIGHPEVIPYPKHTKWPHGGSCERSRLRRRTGDHEH